MSRSTPSPVDGGRPLGELFSLRPGLLRRFEEAEKQKQLAQVSGDLTAVGAASWVVTQALGEIEKNEKDMAEAWLTGMRMAVRHFPDGLSDLVSELSAIREIAEAVAELETRTGN